MECSCPGLVARGGINLGKYPGEKVNWAIVLGGILWGAIVQGEANQG